MLSVHKCLVAVHRYAVYSTQSGALYCETIHVLPLDAMALKEQQICSMTQSGALKLNLTFCTHNSQYCLNIRKILVTTDY